MNREAAEQALSMALLGFLSDVDSFFIGESKCELQSDPTNTELKAEREALRRRIVKQCYEVRAFVPSLGDEVAIGDPELQLIQNKCMTLKELRGTDWTSAFKELQRTHRERFMEDIEGCRVQGGKGFSDMKMYGVSLQYKIAWTTYCKLFEGVLFKEGAKFRSLKDVRAAYEQNKLTGEMN